WEIPESPVRAHVRLRVDGGPLELARLQWQAAGIHPDARLALAASILGSLSLLALSLAGLGLRASFGGAVAILAALAVLAPFDAFAAVHLARRLSWASGAGIVVLLLARLLARGASARLRALVFGALLFKSALLFHPRFYFYDWPIHETLLELLYHRGAIDFRTRLVDYQLAHNIGVAPVGDERLAFPYPVAFYYAAHLGNRLHHAPELWLKLTAAVLAALALLPLGYLARRLTTHAQADLYAALAYLLVPSLTRSLLLLELSAVAGCFFDLLALAALASLELKLDRRERFLFAALAMAASLAAYTTGFVHFGLFVGSALVLGLGVRNIRGEAFQPKDAVRLALAGLLALVLGLLAYPAEAVSGLGKVLRRQEVASPASVEGLPVDEMASAVSRARTFLGIPLILFGVAGLAIGLRKLPPSSLRLLYLSWALSALVAIALRYVFIDLFQYQKEMYWAAAILAVGAGALAASARQPAFAAGLLVALLVSYAWALRRMVEQFYETYLFL
ncbi:MAG TPA: hypothetical protein VIG29_04800, partial [Vicinamibacteria bacterium]